MINKFNNNFKSIKYSYLESILKMTSISDDNVVNTKNQLLDELMEKTHCLCCGEALDGRIWSDVPGLIAKPTCIELEFCYFTCERQYNSIWGFQRRAYNRKTKF